MSQFYEILAGFCLQKWLCRQNDRVRKLNFLPEHSKWQLNLYLSGDISGRGSVLDLLKSCPQPFGLLESQHHHPQIYNTTLKVGRATAE